MAWWHAGGSVLAAWLTAYVECMADVQCVELLSDNDTCLHGWCAVRRWTFAVAISVAACDQPTRNSL